MSGEHGVLSRVGIRRVIYYHNFERLIMHGQQASQRDEDTLRTIPGAHDHTSERTILSSILKLHGYRKTANWKSINAWQASCLITCIDNIRKLLPHLLCDRGRIEDVRSQEYVSNRYMLHLHKQVDAIIWHIVNSPGRPDVSNWRGKFQLVDKYRSLHQLSTFD